MYSLEEKKEQVIYQYGMSYDIDIAMLKCDINADEKKLMLHDDSFMYRISYADASIREKIVSTMVSNLDTEDEKLAQKAAIDLGNLLWKDKFKANSEPVKGVVPDSIVQKGRFPD